jgi:hypothetical protein
MSSAFSTRMLACIFSDAAFAPGCVMCVFSSVLTAPGSTRPIRTPLAVTSWRSDSLKAFTAHLLAL